MNCNWARRYGNKCPHVKEGFLRVDWVSKRRKTVRAFKKYERSNAQRVLSENSVVDIPVGYVMTRHVDFLSAKEFEPQN